MRSVIKSFKGSNSIKVRVVYESQSTSIGLVLIFSHFNYRKQFSGAR